MHAIAIDGTRYTFPDLKSLLAKASPPRSGDRLAGVAAATAAERVAAQMALADLPLAHFLDETIIPYEDDEVTRLIVDSHDAGAFAPIAHLTVGGFRDWLLGESATTAVLAALAPGLTPEMAAAVSKICRNQDLIVVAAKCRVVTRFRNTIGLAGLPVVAPPAEPSDRRPQGRAGVDHRRPAARLRRRRHRHQSRERQHRSGAASSCISSTTCACGSRRRPSPACSPTSPRRWP